MDAIEYVEAAVAPVLKEAQAAYDALHERSYKFVTLVMGAGSAMAVYGLGKVGTAGYLLQLIPLGLWALFLFWVASRLLIKGAATQEMTSGTTGAKLRERIGQHSQGKEGDDVLPNAVILTRWDQVAAVDRQILAYSQGATDRGLALDLAYKRTGFSPLVGLFGYILALIYQTFGHLLS